MIVSVIPAALERASADARRTSASLARSLQDVSSAVAPLQTAWSGRAAEGFGVRHEQWQSAAANLITSLSELATLLDTAHGNYHAAAGANLAIWTRGGIGALTGRGTEGIEAEIEDVRATTRVLAGLADTVADAWTTLAAGLGTTTAMAGDDPVGAAFGADCDAMTAALWQGWRQTVIVWGAIASGLAATGNNIVAAEVASGGRPVARIADAPRAVPQPAAPPSAVGGRGTAPAYWPTADPPALRSAIGPWRRAGEAVRDVAARTRAAVAALVDANPDPALRQMRTFTDALLAPGLATGTVGVLAIGGGAVAEACRLLADATERARRAMAAETLRIAGGDEWYHDVAELADRTVTRGLAAVVARAGDVAMLDLALSRIHTEYAAEVASLRTEIAPAAADRVTAFTASLTLPGTARPRFCTVGVASRAAATEATRQALIDELLASGRKVDPAAVVAVERLPDGRIVWLERGNTTAGLGHILRARRVSDFLGIGVAPADIPGIALRALATGTPLGRSGDGGETYDVDVGGGRREHVVVVVGSNGYIVTAYPKR